MRKNNKAYAKYCPSKKAPFVGRNTASTRAKHILSKKIVSLQKERGLTMNATRKQLLVSGIIQLTIGIFCFIFGIVERVPVGSYRRGYLKTLTSIPCLGIWMGLWIGITGLLGIFTKVKSFKPVTAVYLGFTITSVVFAATMIICYSLSLAFSYRGYYNYGYRSYYSEALIRRGYVMSILILVLSILEFGIGIWASVCCCMAFGRRQPPQTGGVAGQVVYIQTQGGGAATPHVIIQGPDGNPIAVPAQINGPMMEQSGVPPHYSNPAFQQQPQQDATKVPLS